MFVWRCVALTCVVFVLCWYVIGRCVSVLTCCNVLRCAVLCYEVLCADLCCVVLCCAVLFGAVLCALCVEL